MYGIHWGGIFLAFYIFYMKINISNQLSKLVSFRDCIIWGRKGEPSSQFRPCVKLLLGCERAQHPMSLCAQRCQFPGTSQPGSLADSAADQLVLSWRNCYLHSNLVTGFEKSSENTVIIHSPLRVGVSSPNACQYHLITTAPYLCDTCTLELFYFQLGVQDLKKRQKKRYYSVIESINSFCLLLVQRRPFGLYVCASPVCL